MASTTWSLAGTGPRLLLQTIFLGHRATTEKIPRKISYSTFSSIVGACEFKYGAFARRGQGARYRNRRPHHLVTSKNTQSSLVQTHPARLLIRPCVFLTHHPDWEPKVPVNVPLANTWPIISRIRSARLEPGEMLTAVLSAKTVIL